MQFILTFLYKGLLVEKYIDVSATTVKGTLITSSVETTNQMCAVQCYEETLCEAFYYSPTTKECILYDLQSQLYTSYIATSAEIWKTAGETFIIYNYTILCHRYFYK